jgi:hypothetical protein
MKATLQIYSDDGTLKIFDKYTLYHFGLVRNRKTGQVLQNIKNGKYNLVGIYDEGTRYNISISRAIASTFIGPPPSPEHTADHLDRNPDDDNIYNIQWATKFDQNKNQERPGVNKDALIVVRDGIEKTINEWVEYLKHEKNPFGREYTKGAIEGYLKKKMFGFAFKEYPDLPGEIWKTIEGGKSSRGYWMISDMNRIKFITKQAENVLSGERLGMSSKGYPTININNKQKYCHILAFMTFFPDEWAAKKSNENVLHKNDDKLDFRPHMLRLESQSQNIIDAHNNGCYGDAQSGRMKCVSYIDGVYELLHDSQTDAANYLKHIGYKKVDRGSIGAAIGGKRNRKSAYDRTWKQVL